MNELIFKSKKLKDTEKIAISIACFIKIGDLILLNGDLGSGKTTFARAIINSKYFANDQNHIVPSPTFNFLQVYKFDNSVIGHADLYRVKNKNEIMALNLQNIVDEGSLIVEWPEIMGSSISGNILNIIFEIQDDELILKIINKGGWHNRLKSIYNRL